MTGVSGGTAVARLGAVGTVDVVVGVDIGTTHTKAVALDPSRRRRAGLAKRPTSWTYYSDGRVETTGQAIVADVLAVVEAVTEEAAQRLGRPVRAAGIGLAGLAESGVLVDASGEPATPAIAWFDTRGQAELSMLDAEFRTVFPQRVGLPFLPQWSFAKLLWMRAQGVDLGAGRCWLNLPEYVAYALTGNRVSEPTLASRTALFDQATLAPWSPALERLGADGRLLPELLDAGRPAGRVTGVRALRGAVVTVVGHDHAVAAIGAGAVGADQLFNSAGTADVMMRSVPRVLTDAEREQLVASGVDAGRHLLPGRSALIGGLRAGLVLRRVLALLGDDEAPRRAELDRLWRPGAPVDSLRVRGARGSDNDVTITMKDGASPVALWAAALSHVADETRHLLAAMNGVVGEHRSAIAAGGWTRMSSVRATKSQVIPSLAFSTTEEPGALGAALFASWAVAGSPGEFTDFVESVRPPPPPGTAPPTSLHLAQHRTDHQAQHPTEKDTT